MTRRHKERGTTADSAAIAAPRMRQLGARTLAAWNAAPWLSSLLITVAFAAIILVGLRPGYWINDDAKIIWNIVGYPGEIGLNPFVIHGNIIIGFLLTTLYRLPASINWYAVLLSAVNAMSVWALLALVVADRRPFRGAVLRMVVILAASAMLFLNITYTISACLASVAGIALLFRASRAEGPPGLGLVLAGISLILTGSMLRLPMLLLSGLISAPLLIIGGSARMRLRMPFLCLLAAAAVIGMYAVDRLYVRSADEWNKFYAYTKVRESLHDSHRLRNVHGEIRRIGWTANDQELFAHWYFPDEDLYSYDHLRYLAERVQPFSHDPVASALEMLSRFLQWRYGAYALWIVGMLLWMSPVRVPRSAAAASGLIFTLAVAANLMLALIYKDPSYVFAGTLTGAVALVIVILSCTEYAQSEPLRAKVRSAAVYAHPVGLAMIIIGLALAGTALIAESRLNVVKQAGYERILFELADLQAQGSLAYDALIVSPAHGLPYAWSYPFVIDRPIPAFLDTGWITFSPSYNKTLARFGIQHLPDALLERDDVYLMTEESFINLLARYYAEHRSLRVRAEIIYRMPNPSLIAEFDGIVLYQLNMDG